MRTWPVWKGLWHCTMNIKPIVMGEKVMCDALESVCNKRENNTIFSKACMHIYMFVKRALV